MVSVSDGRDKRADFIRSPQTQAFVDAANQAANANIRGEAGRDVGRLGLAMLGLGAAGRGAVGLAGLLKRNLSTRSGPAVITLPYPVEDDDEPAARKLKAAAADNPGGRVYEKVAFDVTRKTAIPWYRPAMMLAGLGGLYGGWKGVDAALDAQRAASRKREVEEARQEFHDALLAQYDKPIKSSPLQLPKKAAQDTAESVAGRLGRVFDRLEKVAQAVKDDVLAGRPSRLAGGTVKAAGRLSDIGGEATGLYGTYAALSGLATGALVYEQARKRQRRAILDKALKRRERHRYYTAPPEIVALPEPVRAMPKPNLKAEMKSLAAPPETELVENKLGADRRGEGRRSFR